MGFIIRKNGYVYSHETRCNGKIVSIVGFRKEEKKDPEYLARFEGNSAHGSTSAICTITGGVDHEGDDPQDAVIRELLEEGGFSADKQELISLGQVRPSKSADTTVYLFAVDLTTRKQQTPQGDGSEGEKHATVKWVSLEETMKSEDPLMSVILLRLFHSQHK